MVDWEGAVSEVEEKPREYGILEVKWKKHFKKKEAFNFLSDQLHQMINFVK